MTQGKPSYLRFSLEESVWFGRQEAVDILQSISLEPNVTIQEHDQYVAIRGSLELTGEYKKVSEVKEDEEEEPYAQHRYVEVREVSEETCAFTHAFPVDITIPNNRVKSLYDLDVCVDSFDYVFPVADCIKLTADLTVTGVIEQVESETYMLERNETTAAEHAEEITLSLPSVDQPVPPTTFPWTKEEFSAEAKRPPSQEDAQPSYVQDENNESSLSEEDQQFVEATRSYHKPYGVVPMPSIEDDDDEEYESSSSSEAKAYEHEEQENAYAPYENTYEDDSEEDHWAYTIVEDEYEEYPPAHKEIKFASKSKDESESSSSSSALSLTDFFARKSEDEVTRLKVCIVQDGDTVDTLAERYEVSAQQLLRVNSLEPTQDVFEGQVLYIPQAVVK
ncbi:stage VI sporulation protein D [Bacillus fonticola]|uniref:stage VI sporulation protein D n=1 Tax=Bacillus fonticola TaxID=2728853 RepID=UPI0014734CA8|nr:stage VI sporulation protein D [Bacillus fonticola]